MSDFGVKETQCTRCGHREVCSLKTEFLEAQKAIDEVYVSRPSAFEALRNIDKEDERFHRLLHTLFYICELADFEIEGRIVLIDKQTGRVWR